MASRIKRSGAGDRVLESKHVIGLFMLVLLFSAIFFTLGYVMGRNQYDGQVRAAGNPRSGVDALLPRKLGTDTKHPTATATPDVHDDTAATNSEWEFYGDKQKQSDDPKGLSSNASAATKNSAAPKNNAEERTQPTSPAYSNVPRTTTGGGYTLQVTAVRRETDALDLAKRLQKRKFPAFVLAPQGNKYYRVLVGPYAELKSAEAAKKGLESAGFRAIVKHG
ncbi:MAG: SPOR domain-containing protein [Acidobacteriota bacterium]|nr:SPOR domain-containing protein [Acidobacteriota bacterium]